MSSDSFHRAALASAEQVARCDNTLVPSYLAPSFERLSEQLAINDGAQIAHLGCRTGFIDGELLERLPESTLYGCDASAEAVACARAKAVDAWLSAEYLVAEPTSTPLPREAFTHALSIDVAPSDRTLVWREMARLLVPGGQLLATVLLRDSAHELTCLLREYAVKFDHTELSRALERLESARPLAEPLEAELETAGFEFVESTTHSWPLTFADGGAFLAHPFTTMVLLPHTERTLRAPLDEPLAYVQRAIDLYWAPASQADEVAREPFSIELSIACLSARRR